MTPRQLPNIITVTRMLLVAPMAWALLHGAFLAGLILFVVASLSDGLDGFLARRYHWQTRLGAILDPVADKMLLVGVYVVLGMHGFVPWWLVIAVILRDVVILGGALAYRLFTGALDVEPTVLSKLNTVLQVALALVAIVARGLGWLPPWSAEIFIFAVLASTLLSGAHYVAIWGRRAWLHRKALS